MRTDKWISDLGIALVLLSKETTWRCSYDEKSGLVDVKKSSTKLAVTPIKKPASEVKDGESGPKLKTLVKGEKPGPKLIAMMEKWMAHRDAHSFMKMISTAAVTEKIQEFCSQYGEAATIETIRQAIESDDFDFKFSVRDYEDADSNTKCTGLQCNGRIFVPINTSCGVR